MLGVSVVKTSITLSRSFSVEILTGLTLSWKTKYLEGCSTAIRCVARKVGLYILEVTSPQGCSFLDRWTCI